MRDRLIELLMEMDKNPEITCPNPTADGEACKGCKYAITEWLCDMTARKADYLLANGVIVPPCKVGDSCYPLNASETELTCEEKISRITISEKNIIIGYYEHWDYYNRCRKTDNWRLPLRTRILGKGVFLTREDAEQALKEREQSDR